MHTLTEIISEIRANWMEHGTLASVYGYNIGDEFNSHFSKVSIEAAITYIWGVSVFTLEKIMDAFSNEIDERIDGKRVMSPRWYHQRAMEYQHSDTVIYNMDKFRFEYKSVDESKRIIQFCSVSEKVVEGSPAQLVIKVANGQREALAQAELDGFKNYIKRIGAAGTNWDIQSNNADSIKPIMTVYYNPLVMTSDGSTLDGKTNTVPAGINQFITTIAYGGIFEVNTMISYLKQYVLGVIDVKFEKMQFDGNKPETTDVRIEMTNGTFIYNENNFTTITYLPVIE